MVLVPLDRSYLTQDSPVSPSRVLDHTLLGLFSNADEICVASKALILELERHSLNLFLYIVDYIKIFK